jgi:hypothetical protein
MALTKDIKIGDKVWVADRSEPREGEIIDIVAESGLVCIKLYKEYQTVDLRSTYTFLTQKDALLYLGKKKQQEASELLSKAADLFFRAGNL